MEEMFWIGGGVRLWAMMHQPVNSSGAPVETERAVLFCPPFAEEEKCSRRLYVDLARRLASDGVGVVRFSYGGTADSEGDFSAFTLESARGDLQRALQETRRRTGAKHLIVFGLRLGGSLALDALGPEIAGLAVWAPVVNGRSYVRMNFRRKAIRSMMIAGAAEAADATQPASQSPSTEPADIFDFDGYPVARSLWNELEALSLASPPPWQGRSLIVSVGPGENPTAECANLAKAMAAQGAETRVEAVIAQPFWNLLGIPECPKIIDLTASWMIGEM